MWLGVVIFLVFIIVSSFLGHLVHWVLHQRWSGWANHGHMQHHALYPPVDLRSRSYRRVNWFNSGPFLFTPAFLAVTLLLGAVALYFHVSFLYVVIAAVALALFGIFNDIVHDSFHIKDNWFDRFSAYRKLRDLHFVHHRNMKQNFGIVTFVWDKAFGTFRSK